MAFGGLAVLVWMGSVPRVKATLGSVRAGRPPLSRGRRRRWHAVSERDRVSDVLHRPRHGARCR